jgi:hypothetical protein
VPWRLSRTWAALQRVYKKDAGDAAAACALRADTCTPRTAAPDGFPPPAMQRVYKKDVGGDAADACTPRAAAAEAFPPNGTGKRAALHISEHPRSSI